MKFRTITGIDIGTSLVKVIVLRESIQKTEHEDDKKSQILGVGYAESKGLRHGTIINETEVARCVRSAVAQAEKSANVKVSQAYISVGGISVETRYAHSDTIASRPDQVIVDLDIEKALAYSEDTLHDTLTNTHILERVPLRYTLDGKKVYGKPQGMRGTKLSVDSFFIGTSEQQYQGIIRAVERAGIAVIDAIASPIATSLTSVTKAQKRVGCILVDIGSETTTIIVFEDSLPIFTHVFPLGSSDITNAIALAFKVSLEEADKLKRHGAQSNTHPKKQLEHVIAEEYRRIFDAIRTHLESKKVSLLLPAGVLLTGGGAISPHATDLARAVLELPIKMCPIPSGKSAKLRDPIWSTAYGTCVFGTSEHAEESGVGTLKKAGGSLKSWFKQFLP